MSEPWKEIGYNMNNFYEEMHIAKKLKELKELKEIMSLVKKELVTLNKQIGRKNNRIKNTISLITDTEKDYKHE